MCQGSNRIKMLSVLVRRAGEQPLGMYSINIHTHTHVNKPMYECDVLRLFLFSSYS